MMLKGTLPKNPGKKVEWDKNITCFPTISSQNFLEKCVSKLKKWIGKATSSRIFTSVFLCVMQLIGLKLQELGAAITEHFKEDACKKSEKKKSLMIERENISKFEKINIHEEKTDDDYGIKKSEHKPLKRNDVLKRKKELPDSKKKAELKLLNCCDQVELKETPPKSLIEDFDSESKEDFERNWLISRDETKKEKFPIFGKAFDVNRMPKKDFKESVCLELLAKIGVEHPKGILQEIKNQLLNHSAKHAPAFKKIDAVKRTDNTLNLLNEKYQHCMDVNMDTTVFNKPMAYQKKRKIKNFEPILSNQWLAITNSSPEIDEKIDKPWDSFQFLGSNSGRSEIFRSSISEHSDLNSLGLVSATPWTDVEPPDDYYDGPHQLLGNPDEQEENFNNDEVDDLEVDDPVINENIEECPYSLPEVGYLENFESISVLDDLFPDKLPESMLTSIKLLLKNS